MTWISVASPSSLKVSHTLTRAIVQLELRPIFGLILLYLAALAPILIGIYPMGPSIQPDSIHQWSRLTIFLTGGLAPLLLTLRLRSIATLESVAGPLLILAVVVLVVGIAGFFITDWVGLVQQIHILLLDVWVIRVSLRGELTSI